MAREVRFDDIAAIRELVSTEYGPWGAEVEVTQDMIQRFSDLTGDHQWIHTDVERARRESPFGGPIAHGFLTLSLLGSLRPPLPLSLVGHKNVTNYGAAGLRFVAPVPAGSRIHARARLTDVQQRSTGTLLSVETVVHVVGKDKPSLVYNGLALYQGARA